MTRLAWSFATEPGNGRRPVSDADNLSDAIPAELYNRLSDFAQWAAHDKSLLFSARRRAINVALTAAAAWVRLYVEAVERDDRSEVRRLLGEPAGLPEAAPDIKVHVCPPSGCRECAVEDAIYGRQPEAGLE